ncbi:EpsG family protein [Fusobacterium animalis]|uniref:EpsG family protein n=1 Tax=Fusobacterium animalis TaxID=76859 RepID=UPI001C6EF9B1|nr:EpsG family protein [Fusobacterium animalis]QYR67276.1 EpsG family protein [Fusobacterium animalis]
MITYIYLSIFFLLGIIKNEFFKNKKSNFLIILMIFLFAFSYRMGSDWLVYQDWYENIFAKLSLYEIVFQYIDVERGYVLLNFIFFHLGFSYELFMGTLLSVCSFIILKFIQKESKNYYLAFYFFLINGFLVALLEPIARQLIAVTFFIIAIKYMKERKIYKYIFTIIIATQFHESAFLLLPLYFIKHIKFSLKKVFFITLSSKILLDIFLIVIFSILPKYGTYLNSERYMPKAGNIKMYIICFYYIFIIFNVYKGSRKNNNYTFVFSSLFVIIYFLTTYFPIIKRFNVYFLPFMSITISYIGEISVFKRKVKNSIKKPFIILGTFLLFTTMFYKNYYLDDLNRFRYLNYKNYFIELSKENIAKNFYEKSSSYKEKMDILQTEEKNN